EEATAVDGWDRTVAAVMQAPPTRLHISHQLPPSLALELRVALERWKLRAARHGKVESLQVWPRLEARQTDEGHRAVYAPFEGPNQIAERAFDLAADDAIHAVREEVRGVEPRVEAEEVEMTSGIHSSDALGHGRTQSKRCVHGDGDGNELGA